jgi:hypothetical protein
MPNLNFAELIVKLLVGAEPAAARQELRPLDDLKATDARPFGPSAVLMASFFRSGQNLYRHKLYPAPAAEAGFTIRLYQISHLPVKENLSIYLCLFNAIK